MNNFKINNKIIGDKELFFVIEEGMANWGSVDKALQMILTAANLGANAIEFQVFYADDFIVKQHPNYNLIKQLELSDDEFQKLIKLSNINNIAFIATALSPSRIEKMNQLGCHAFNINASDINNPDIIDEICKTKKPFFLSIPLATEDEIEWAIERIYKNNNKSSFAILHGQHPLFSEPEGVKYENTCLGYLQNLKQKYKIPVGFIDHTSSLNMSAIAVAAGADVVTKHLTLNRLEKGPDWQICLEPNEMKECISLSHKIKSSLLVKEKLLNSGEEKDRKIMRKSIVAKHNIQKNQIIEKNDIAFKRPGEGIAPCQYDKIIGKKANKEILMDEIIKQNDLY